MWQFVHIYRSDKRNDRTVKSDGDRRIDRDGRAIGLGEDFGDLQVAGRGEGGVKWLEQRRAIFRLQRRRKAESVFCIALVSLDWLEGKRVFVAMQAAANDGLPG